jgi:hypothetical protein
MPKVIKKELPKFRPNVHKQTKRELKIKIDGFQMTRSIDDNKSSKHFLMLIALQEILYRWDKSKLYFFLDDGIYRCGSHAAFIKAHGNKAIADLFDLFINDYLVAKEDDYEKFLCELAVLVMKQLRNSADRKIEDKINLHSLDLQLCHYKCFICYKEKLGLNMYLSNGNKLCKVCKSTEDQNRS